MVTLINLAPLFLTLACLLVLAVLYLKIKRMNEGSVPLLKAVLVSNQHVKEISDKIDDISDDVEEARLQQQKIFDHHRVLCGSLNSQLVNLELMLSNPSAPAVNEKEIAHQAEPNSPKAHSLPASVLRLNRDNLPKTENGMQLLEEVFKRKAASNIRTQQRKRLEEAPVMLRGKAQASKTPNETSDDSKPAATPTLVETSEQADESNRHSRRSILQLFNERGRGESRHEELMRRSA